MGKPLNLYSIDVQLVATAYIKAKNPTEARRMLKKAIADDGCVFADNEGESTLPVCGLSYDNPALPTISLSPAMTAVRPMRGHDFSQEDVPPYEEPE